MIANIYTERQRNFSQWSSNHAFGRANPRPVKCLETIQKFGVLYQFIVLLTGGN